MGFKAERFTAYLDRKCFGCTGGNETTSGPHTHTEAVSVISAADADALEQTIAARDADITHRSNVALWLQQRAEAAERESIDAQGCIRDLEQRAEAAESALSACQVKLEVYGEHASAEISALRAEITRLKSTDHVPDFVRIAKLVTAPDADDLVALAAVVRSLPFEGPPEVAATLITAAIAERARSKSGEK